MSPTLQPRPIRHAFTLVEVLTVIIIIGILAGLIIAAVGPARIRARNAAITLEIHQLSMALEAYKDKYGDYPPDFFGVMDDAHPDVEAAARNAVVRHLRKAFPQYVMTPGDEWATFGVDLSTAGIAVSDLGPDMALAFWLGGLPDRAQTESTKLIGFNADPAHPFAPGGKRLPPLFEFAETRLTDENPTTGAYKYCYYADASTGSQPYIYFRARMDNPTSSVTQPSNRLEYGYSIDNSTFAPFYCSRPGNVCVPYLEDAWAIDITKGTKTLLGMASDGSDPPNQPGHFRKWAEAKKFQIISAGLDGLYGSGIAFRFLMSSDRIGGANLTEGDYDNLSNFLSGKLEDHKQ